MGRTLRQIAACVKRYIGNIVLYIVAIRVSQLACHLATGLCRSGQRLASPPVKVLRNLAGQTYGIGV
ncbi:MAG: hypothetical protein DRR04_09740 [Gammaproteobacteria bacterium]|nr:MAG: hypothetical protein DRR04_09740 [Gammaproteobacteria bacterium]